MALGSEVKEISERVKEESGFVTTLHEAIGKVIVGQQYMIDRLLIGLLSRGHVLLEGVPGANGVRQSYILSRNTGTRTSPAGAGGAPRYARTRNG